MNVDQLRPELHLKLSCIDFGHQARLEAGLDVRLDARPDTTVDAQLEAVLEASVGCEVE